MCLFVLVSFLMSLVDGEWIVLGAVRMDVVYWIIRRIASRVKHRRFEDYFSCCYFFLREKQ